MPIKNTKTFDEDPPPYTAHSSQHPATASTGSGDISVVVTLKLYRPAHLWNAQDCQIQRSGPVNSTTPDAVRLPDSYAVLLSEIQQRTAQRFSLSISQVERGGRLAYRPVDKDETGSEKAGKKAKGVVKVDSKSWEAVRVLLAQGKAGLTFEVEDVPRGWTTVRVRSKTKAKEEEGEKKGTCAVM